MTGNAPLPAIDPNDLGAGDLYQIDRLLVPYVIGQLMDLTNQTLYYGDIEDVIGTGQAFEDLIAQLTAGASGVLGQIIMYATLNPPANCLACDGAIYNRVDYPTLYAALAPNFILSANTFTVPDYRARLPYGSVIDEEAPGTLLGTNFIELIEENIPEHTHTGVAHSHATTEAAHNHNQVAHNHLTSEAAHSHPIPHAHPVAGRSSGAIGNSSSFLRSNGTTGAGGDINTGATGTPNSSGATTGLTVNGSVATNVAATTGLTVNNAVASVGAYGGNDDGNTIPINIDPRSTVTQFAIVAR